MLRKAGVVCQRDWRFSGVFASAVLAAFLIACVTACASATKYFAAVDDQRAALDRTIEAAPDDETLITHLAATLESSDYNTAHYAYSKLIDRFQQSDPAPLLAGYDKASSTEIKVWLASVLDYAGNPELLERLRDEVHGQLRGEERQRAAIAVAFKLGDPSVAPYLIEALRSNFPLWKKGVETTSAPAAAYLLTRLTNYDPEGSHPTHLLNFSCWVMPPPVDPYPVPTGWGLPQRRLEAYANEWREWWDANGQQPQTDWVLLGLARDVTAFANDAESPSEELVSRLRWFLDVDPRFADDPVKDVKRAWRRAQQKYELPQPLTK